MRRRIFIILLLLLTTALCWSIAAWRYTNRGAAGNPSTAAQSIEQDLHRRYTALENLLSDKALLERFYEGRESAEDFRQWTGVPFALFLYENGELRAWNSGTVPAPEPLPLQQAGALVTSATGCSIRIARGLAPGQSLVAMLPVKWVYAVENQYLTARFAASPAIPTEIEVVAQPVHRGYQLRGPQGADWGYVHLPATATVSPIAPRTSTILLALFGLLCFAAVVHAGMLWTLNRVGRRWALLVPLIVVGGLRALTYALPLPFGLRELPLFSSDLYGFSAALPSLGDLFVNALCLLAIAGFAAAHGPAGYHSKRSILRRGGDALGAVPILAAIAAVSFLTVRIIQSLVVDSQIPFDVGRFHTANEYTVWGFVSLGALAAGTALLLKVLGDMATALMPQGVFRYSLLVAISLLLGFGLFDGIGPAALVIAVALWTPFFILLLERPWSVHFNVASAPRIIAAMVLLAFSVGSLLQYFLNLRTYEKDMVAFAEQVVGQEDPIMEYIVSDALQALASEPDIREFLRAPNPERRPQLDARLEVVYLTKNLTDYSARLYFFGASGQPLFNRDTASQREFEERLAIGIPKGTDGLFYNPTATHGRHYTARIRITDALGSDTIGTLYIDLALRRTIAETVYPELLQPEGVQGTSRGSGYPYAVYAGGLPVTQTENYSFPDAAPATGGVPGPIYRSRDGRRELWYTSPGSTPSTPTTGDSSIDANISVGARTAAALQANSGARVAIVVGPRSRSRDSAALFSYLFAVLVMLAGIAVLYRAVLKWGRRRLPSRAAAIPRLSLRQSIHLAMLGLVFLSLVAVGVVTVVLFNSHYREDNEEQLRSTVSVVARSLRQSSSWRLASGADQVDSIARSPRIRYRLAAIAEAQKSDVSLFGIDGILAASSQEEIYVRGLLPRQMRPDAFRALRAGQPVVLQRERVGDFTYQSAYTPLRSDEGNVLGYVNVPFFSSEKELNDQISGLLVTLINLYALLFLLATGLAYLITRGLTRTLAIITERFRKLSLHRNETLDWPYDDEIGLLVGEYNKMVKQVEENAASLVRSEREGAWREMARQVAHEIKNPLTPMKLQIQYLQRALHEGRDDVRRLAERVSGTLVEQIDNLSRIASEFSDFARLPEAQPEVLELSPLLRRTADLHRAEGHVDISVVLPTQTVMVRADHSHLLRALTNLVQNAVQAIPDDRKPHVRILLETGERLAIVRIADNGRGILASEQAKIFRPYFTTKSSGTGLGLAMTRQMVEGWGGRIWFKSEEGAGTEFFMEIPLAAPADAA